MHLVPVSQDELGVNECHDGTESLLGKATTPLPGEEPYSPDTPPPQPCRDKCHLSMGTRRRLGMLMQGRRIRGQGSLHGGGSREVG